MVRSNPSSSNSAPGADDLTTRSNLARWIALRFAGEDDPSGAPPATDGLPPAVAQAARRLRAEDPTALESERVRLFVNALGGVPAPPYASWWLDGELGGPSSAAVRTVYLQEGLRIGDGAGLPDSLSAELEFVHFLLQHQIAARRTGADDLEHATRRRERRFLDEHLTRWMPSFCTAAREATGDAYWLAAIDLVESFVESEAARARTVEPTG